MRVSVLATASGVPAGLYCQGPGGKALAMAVEAARHGAEPIAVAALTVAALLNRVSAEVLCEALTGLDFEHGVDQLVLEGSDFTGARLGTPLEYDAATGALSMNDTTFAILGTAFDHPALSAGDLHIV